MKKILFLIALAVVTSVSLSACTEEVVAPKSENTTGDGSGTTDPIKP